MKVIAERTENTVVDRLCDVCNQSVMININGHQYEECRELSAQWGYSSKESGSVYQLDLCESCFKVALYALKDHRRSNVLFDDDNALPDENFGLDLERTLRDH